VSQSVVTQGAFEASVRAAEAAAAGPQLGLFGPNTMAWRICRDSIVFLGAGRAALLQLSHPYVAHAIEQHSATRADPIGRFNRTFLNVYSMIFGDLEGALQSARRVRRVHDSIQGPIGENVGRFDAGDRYRANDAGALLWVHATLIESAVMAYEIGSGPLSHVEKEEFYRQMSRVAGLFGLSEELLPPDWSAFKAYCAEMVAGPELAVGRPAREIGQFLFAAARPSARPVMAWYRAMTAGLMPTRLRELWDLSFGRREELVYAASGRAIRRAWPHVSERLRFVPAYFEARMRLAGRPGPDLVGRGMEKLVLRFIRPPLSHESA
jgi:uncharacterized protein (DUF2236 family)